MLFRIRKNLHLLQAQSLKNSRALLFALDNVIKSTSSDVNFSTALTSLINDIVAMIALLDRDDLVSAYPTVSPFTVFLVYKAAAITTVKLQADVDPGANLQRLRVQRRILKSITQRWLVGGKSPLSNNFELH